MTFCGMCKRLLNNASDPLSADCGGDCWGCIGAIEAEGGDEESLAKYNEEVRNGTRPGPEL